MSFIKKNTILLLICIFSSLNINGMQGESWWYQPKLQRQAKLGYQPQPQRQANEETKRIVLIELAIYFISQVISIHSIDSTKENVIKSAALVRSMSSVYNLLKSYIGAYKNFKGLSSIVCPAILSMISVPTLLQDYRIINQARALATKNMVRKNDKILKNQKIKQYVWLLMPNLILIGIIRALSQNKLIAGCCLCSLIVSEIIRAKMMYNLIEQKSKEKEEVHLMTSS